MKLYIDMKEIGTDGLEVFKRLHNLFVSDGFNIMIAGGAVRDLVIGLEINDIDFATDASPEDMIKIARRNNITFVPTGIEHGTVTFVIDEEHYEITTLRVDKETDGRHATVEFCKSFEEDAKRRDFTINAMFVTIDGEIIDYVGGIEDCRKKLIRFVGDPTARIEEDYLRIIRAFRFKSRYGFNFETETEVALNKDHTDGLVNISAERLWSEFKKMIYQDHNIINEILDKPYGKIFPLKNSIFSGDLKCDELFILSLYVDKNDAKNVSEFFKMSREEKAKLMFAVHNHNSEKDVKFYTDMIVEGNPSLWVHYLLHLNASCFWNSICMEYTKIDDTIRRYSNKLTRFPVNGNDLLSNGFKAGPELGKELKRLRQVWIDSDFKMSKDDLVGLINT